MRPLPPTTGRADYVYGDVRSYAPGGFSEQASGMSIGKSLAIGAVGAVAACGLSAVMWAAMQRRREENKPINRARRQLEGWTYQLRSDERVAPAGGASALALVGSVLLARALVASRERSAAEAAAAQAGTVAHGIAAAGLKTAAAALNAAAASLQAASENPPISISGWSGDRSLRCLDTWPRAARIGSDRRARAPVGRPSGRPPWASASAGWPCWAPAGYLIWRLLNRPEPQSQTWQIEPSRQ